MIPRFLQPLLARERAALSNLQEASLPTRISPAEFSPLGAMVAVRCPFDFAPLARIGIWEPGSKRWLVERRRINPLIRNLRRATDPLFRHAGIDLDGEGA